MTHANSTPANSAQGVSERAVEALAEFLCSEFDEDFNPCHGYSWPEHKDDDGYRGGNAYVKLQPSDVQARAREGATRILTFLSQRAALTAAIGAGSPLKGDEPKQNADFDPFVQIEVEGESKSAASADGQPLGEHVVQTVQHPAIIPPTSEPVPDNHVRQNPAIGAGGQAVAVKALEWRNGYRDETVNIQQASFGGLYQVRILDGVIWLDWPDHREAVEFSSVEAAKAAAQADFERRILSAIVHPVQQGWRDIESAPKDGVRILVIGGRHLEPEIVPADGDWWRHYGGNAAPTHWMPLTAALQPKGG